MALRPLIIVLLLPALAGGGAPASAQAPDSVGAARPAPVPDSAAATTGESPVPVAPGGSLSTGALPVAVIPDSGFRFIPYRSAADLRFPALGAFTSTTGLGGFRARQSVHGLAEGSIAFLADGMLLNSPATGLYSPELYPAEFADRVESSPAPAAFTHGFNATGAAVNFVSRSSRAPRPVSRIFYTQSSYGTSLLDGSLRQDVARGVNVELGIQRPVSDGRFANSALDGWNSRLKVRYDAGGASVYASDIYTRMERGLNDGVSLATPESLRHEPIRALVVNGSASERIVRHDAAAGVSVGSDTSALTGFDLQFSGALREYRDELSGRGSTGTPFRDTREEETAGLRLSHSRPVAGGRVSAVVELRNRRLLRDPNIGAAKSTQAAVSVAVRTGLPGVFTLIPSGRYERYLGVDRVAGGARAEARIAPGVTAAAGLSRSYRFPSFAETRGVAGFADPLPSPDPERHDVGTAGLTAGDSAGTRITVGAFHRTIHGAALLDSAAAGSANPLGWRRTGKETRQGVTIDAVLRIGVLEAEVNACYLSYGAATARRRAPAWDLGGGLYVRDRAVGGHLDLKAGFRGRYFTRFDGEGYAQRYELFTPSVLGVAPAATLDFILFAGIGDAVVHVIWENLLDRKYTATIFYPADDRSFRFGVTWDFLD